MHMSRWLLLAAVTTSSPALAGGKKDLLKTIEQLEEMSDNYDPAVFDIYDDDAVLTTTAESPFAAEPQVITMTGSQLKEGGAMFMEMAREKNEQTDLVDMVVKPHEGGFRVTGTRRVLHKCYDDSSYESVWKKNDEGQWRIVSENLAGHFFSQCEDAPSKAAQVNTTLAGMLAKHLPMQIDAETTLSKITAKGDILVYEMGLPNVSKADIDLDQITADLTTLTHDTVCGDPRMQPMFSVESSILYHWVDGQGEALIDVPVTAQTCQ